ncbi:hypothetical protein YYC_04819 [Plasmodium yoelii 17X]|uniref:BIR protein n=1 Tax=Plasmodium yoelii 17X TaxID=1323249 RepID=V7PCL5_PLAYE|nr:hypothetical protein YYC_04819 [Plasmodium yoelii 17X]
MDDETACDLFYEADKLLNGSTDIHKEINSFPEYLRYCPNNRPCSNRVEGIGALSGYLFTALNNDDKVYSEYFMMWLAHNLFKIAQKIKNSNANEITLSSAYEQYLKKNMGNFENLNILNNLMTLQNVNLRHMSELYTLLNHICNTIAYYKKNNEKHKNLSRNSIKCLNQYRTLYNVFSGNDTYLSLLQKLKKIYDDFRTAAIENDADKKYNIEKRLLELTKMNEKNNEQSINLQNIANKTSTQRKEPKNSRRYQGKSIKLTKESLSSKSKASTSTPKSSTT